MFGKAVGVLVREDYSGYTNLPLIQQSCWAHLLRVSHNLAERQEASEEVKQVHKKLKELFGILAEDVTLPFERGEREELQQWYAEDLEKIIHTTYTAKDAIADKTRVRNQRNTLLTALLYPNTPLTNNEAERAVLPLVIQRKISRDSKTQKGAETRAINMSIIQTITKRNLPLLDTLQKYLLNSSSA